MKKIKIMLLSLALFAVVGGALAFKAKFQSDWCIAPLYGNGFTCTTLFQGDTLLRIVQIEVVMLMQGRYSLAQQFLIRY